MTGIIYINGVIGEDYKVSDALLDVQKNKINDNITLKIGSVGGFVDVADEIYNIFKNTGKITRTENIGDVASAAVKLFLLAPKESRFFDTSKGVFLIHNPYMPPEEMFGMNGDAAAYQLIADELGVHEKALIKFYAESTGTDFDILKGFMNINEPLTSEQISALGFAQIQQIEFKAVAKINNLNIQEMNENDLKNVEGVITRVFNKLFPPKVVNLMVADASGKNLDFGTQIETMEQIAVGMTVKFEDGSIPVGEVAMPDGKTLVFDEAGIITEIKEAEGSNTEVEIEALKTENETLKAEIETLKGAQAKLEAEHVLNLKNVRAQFTSEMVNIIEESYVKKPEVETTITNRVQKMKELKNQKKQ